MRVAEFLGLDEKDLSLFAENPSEVWNVLLRNESATVGDLQEEYRASLAE